MLPTSGAPKPEPGLKDNAGVHSIEVGAALLRVLADGVGPMKLTDLAGAAGMSSSRAHKYLASFLRCGLVRQTGPAGRYGLGPLAVELGFAALRNMDVVELAQETLDDLRDRLQTVTSLTIWANRGPTIIRRSVHEQSVSLVVQLGAVMTMLTSSNGRVFSAYLAKELTGPLIEAELADPQGLAARAGLRSLRDVEAMLDAVRSQGFAVASGTHHRGIVGASAPVFDYTGKIVAALTLVGMEGVLNVKPDGVPIQTLLKAAAHLSSHVGGHPADHSAAGRTPVVLRK
ncbi:MAG: IclR family transcriptional regulator [Pseudolabrys sp.]|nr:IclR family transcriptional regulator [Pseudolabrys sp.]